MESIELKEKKKSLMDKLCDLENRVGNTPFVKLHSFKNTYSKLEFYQLGDSIKIRPALHIVKNAIRENLINRDTVIIESTSGNFGIALSIISKYLGLKFIGVIDKNTPKRKEDLLRLYGADVVMIEEKDETGGYLLNRVKYIEDYKKENNENCFHPNQYQNINNPKSYYVGMGEEICNYFEDLDAVIVAVSSGGTITGLSRKLKLKFPDIKVIAVDVEGSFVFQNRPHKRNLSGIGSSMKSDHIKDAIIDRVEILNEEEILKGCKDLLDDELIFGGSSSGAAYATVKKYKEENPDETVLFICPDSGLSYINNFTNK